MDAIHNVRSYLKLSVPHFYPPHGFPFEESKYMPHLLLNKLNFLVLLICTGFQFRPLASETYSNEDQYQEDKTLIGSYAYSHQALRHSRVLVAVTMRPALVHFVV